MSDHSAVARLGLNFTSKIHHDTYPEVDTAAGPASCAGKTVLVTGAAKGIGRESHLYYGQQGLLAYSVHPASVPTDLAKRMPDAVVKAVCVDTPELAGDGIAFLTRERREWLAGRYISCTWDMPELVARQEEIVEKNLLTLRMSF